MNRALQWGLTVAALAGTGLAAWVGAGVYAGTRAENELRALLQAGNRPEAAFRLTALRHQRGWLSSQGEMELALQPGCGDDADDDPVTVRVSYDAAHLPQPRSALRFDWRVHPMGDTAKAFKQAFGTDTPLTGTGSVDYQGGVRSTWSLPKLSMRRAGSAMQMEPSSGTLGIQGAALDFDGTLPRMIVRGQGQAVEVKELALRLNLTDRVLGTGKMAVSMGTMTGEFGALEKLSIESEARENGDRLDMRFTPTLGKLTAQGQTLEALALEMTVQGLDTASVRLFSTLLGQTCGFESLTAEESRQLQAATKTLLSRGLSAGIGRLAGKSPDGAIEGKLMVELAPAKDGRLSLAAQLRSNGFLQLTGNLVTAEQRELAVSTKLAVQEGSALRASYDYAEGKLKVNGEPLEAQGFVDALESADQMIAVWMGVEPPARRTRQAAAPAAPAASDDEEGEASSKQ